MSSGTCSSGGDHLVGIHVDAADTGMQFDMPDRFAFPNADTAIQSVNLYRLQCIAFMMCDKHLSTQYRCVAVLRPYHGQQLTGNCSLLIESSAAPMLNWPFQIVVVVAENDPGDWRHSRTPSPKRYGRRLGRDEIRQAFH